jgi:cellulose synthase/poly-beta-1,6-N-acetylglucosamine synthase-like glycosyltransferase
MTIAWWVFAGCLAVPVYAFLGYPLLLKVVGLVNRRGVAKTEPAEWPSVSITVPAYNEESTIAATLDRVLDVDYPADRRQVLVISDCSSDRTDEIVRSYADRGVELLRLEKRSGKTAAENASRAHIHGEIVINTDASVRLDTAALKHLVMALGDPTVGAASSHDVSVATQGDAANRAEGSYVGYEMWVRRLETGVYGIVGASGSLYAVRRRLHAELVPEALSRDFAVALVTRRHGLRTVSADDALCYVPRNPSLRREYRRKVRTMARGLETLWFHRGLLNPLRYGLFAWMLFSHKLVRWLVPWALALAVPAWLLAGPPPVLDASLLLVGVLVLGSALVGWLQPEGRRLPRLLGWPGYFVVGQVAALHAWIKALSGEMNPVWEPTRRGPKSG